MEPLTHFLTGASIARGGLNRKTALATAVLTVSAEIADLDLFYELNGPVSGFQHHRGWTHTFLGAPVMGALAIALVLAVDRLWPWKRKPRKIPVHYGWLALCGLVGALSHILLDYTNAYGVRPFMPFTYRWYHWDIMPIVDLMMLLFLIGGLVMPKLFALIQEEIGARRSPGRGGPIFALALVLALWGFRDFEHRRSIAAMSALEYGEGLPIRLSAFPGINPLRWYGVVENETNYVTFQVDSLKPEVDPAGIARTWRKSPDSPVVEAAKQSRLGQVYLDWADYPLIQVEPVISTGGHRVTFLDMRYSVLLPTALSAAEILDKDLRVTGIIMGGYFHARTLRGAAK